MLGVAQDLLSRRYVTTARKFRVRDCTMLSREQAECRLMLCE